MWHRCRSAGHEELVAENAEAEKGEEEEDGDVYELRRRPDEGGDDRDEGAARHVAQLSHRSEEPHRAQGREAGEVHAQGREEAEDGDDDHEGVFQFHGSRK